MTAPLRATPFHARAVEANRHNAWENRAGFTLATDYGSFAEEAVAARFGAVLADTSWHWRARISGARSGEFVARCFTRDASALGFGAATEVLWLNDGGAVRGSGTILREERDSFVVVSSLEDRQWLCGAAALYGVAVEDCGDEGVLVLIGPAAGRILSAAGLDADMPILTRRRQHWGNLDVFLSRLGIGFEIWCDPDDALIVWDRLIEAGRAFALLPAGQAALDIIEFECGMMRPGRDFAPARDGFTPDPAPQTLGLCALIDPAHMFNGRRAYRAAGPETTLWGVLLEAEVPAAGVPLTCQGEAVGRIVSARYSPAMRRAIAFAVLNQSVPGIDLQAGTLVCRPTGLPFLPIPSPMLATESTTPAV